MILITHQTPQRRLRKAVPVFRGPIPQDHFKPRSSRILQRLRRISPRRWSWA